MNPTHHDPAQPQLPLDDESTPDPVPTGIHTGTGMVQRELEQLRIDNARLRKLLALGKAEARAAAPARGQLALQPPGPVTAASSEGQKIAFYMDLFRARTDVFALRWENAAEGKSG